MYLDTKQVAIALCFAILLLGDRTVTHQSANKSAIGNIIPTSRKQSQTPRNYLIPIAMTQLLKTFVLLRHP